MRSRITISIILLIILIGVISCCFLLAETEVESYTIGMKIIEKDFSSYYKIYEGKKTIYIIKRHIHMLFFALIYDLFQYEYLIFYLFDCHLTCSKIKKSFSSNLSLFIT